MPGTAPPSRGTLFDGLLKPRVVFAVYCLAAIIATIVKLAPGSFVQDGIRYQTLQNFAIFRNSFFHLIHHQNLYAQFLLEQWDFYRYSPAFALLFAPFALLPYAIGAVVWNVFNAAALFLAVHTIPALDERKKTMALWFMFLAMLNSIGNAQSNALVAALMIGAWSAQERAKADASALCIVAATFIKLFGVFALVPCLVVSPQTSRGRRNLLGFTTAWIAVFALLPLLAVSFSEIRLLYTNWYTTVRAFNEARLGISFMGFLKAWLHLDAPANLVAASGAVVLIATAALSKQPRILVLASVLIFVTIFNYAAESPSYILAVAGVALWYFAQARTPLNLALLAATFLFSMLSSTDLVPRALRREYLDAYVIKALPCIAVWIKLQWDLIRVNRLS